ncbi:hypothetical protein DYH09_15315 [bacterium CPR1]|nr:hypothetical protein [bacterium CPR1]
MLFTILWISTLIMLMMATVGKSVSKSLNDDHRELYSARGRFSAYSGTQRVLARLRLDANYGQSGTYDPDAVNESFANGVYCATFEHPIDRQLKYQIKVINRVGASGTVVGAHTYDDPTDNIKFQTGGGIPVPGGQVYLMTQGYDSAVPANLRAFGGSAGVALQQTSSFDYGAEGHAGVDIKSSEVDSWDRSEDSYDPSRAITDPTKFVTVATTNKVMNLANAADSTFVSKIQGDVMVKPDTTTPVANYLLDPDDALLGERKNLATARSIEQFKCPFDPPGADGDVNQSNWPQDEVVTRRRRNGPDETYTIPASLPPGNYNDLTFESGANRSLTLRSGRYYFNKIDMDSGEIKVDTSQGPVVVYVGEEMKVYGQAKINDGGLPRNLQVYMCDELEVEEPGESIDIDGDGAPDVTLPATTVNYSKLEIDDASKATMVTAGKGLVATVSKESELFGAMIGKYITFSESKLHFDVSLQGASLGLQGGWLLDGLHDI